MILTRKAVGTEHGGGGMERSQLSRQRSAAGHSQESLAEALGVDRTTVGRWERGMALPQPWVRQRLATEVSVSMRQLDDLLYRKTIPPGVRTSSTARSDEPRVVSRNRPKLGSWDDDAIPALRRLLGTYDMPDDGPVRSMPWLRQSVSTVVAWRLNAQYSRIIECLPTLIPELTRAAFTGDESSRSEAFALLTQAYRAADAIADKLGFCDLSARIIDVMRWAARQSGNEVVTGTAAYVRAETFFTTEQFALGQTMLEQAADKIAPGSSLDARAVHGALHMRAAVAACRAGSTSRASAHLTEAQGIACHVPDGMYAGTAFGSSSVRIHQLTVALELDDLGTVFGLAAGWAPPDSVPAERRSHYFIDLARAQHQAGRHDSSLEALSTATRIAPEHVRVHPQTRMLAGNAASIATGPN